MPLDGTVHRAPRRKRDPLRAVAAGWVAIILLGVLAGCATGNVEESRLAETREATHGAVLPGIQATRVIKDFFPPTPHASPTRTPVPTIATLTLATQIGSDNQPSNEVASVSQGSTVYAVAELHSLSAGQTVVAVWTTADGFEVGRSSVPIDRGLSGAWVPLEWYVNVGPGAYAVYVFVDNWSLTSLTFRVN